MPDPIDREIDAMLRPSFEHPRLWRGAAEINHGNVGMSDAPRVERRFMERNRIWADLGDA